MESKAVRSRGTLTFEEKGDQPGSYEGRRKTGSFKTQGGSQRKGAISRQSELAKEARHKRQRSSDGSAGSHQKRNGEREGEANGRPPPAQKRRRNQCSADTTQRPRDARPKAPTRRRSAGLEPREESRKAGRNSPKHRPHLSPEARARVRGPLSGLFTHTGALAVALGELRAPGGAFLPGPAGGTQPAAEQRAWLTWQLAHAGEALHWAVATLDAALSAQLPPGGPLPSWPPLGCTTASCAPGAHFFQGPTAV